MSDTSTGWMQHMPDPYRKAEFKKGDRVHVEFDGVVSGRFQDDPDFTGVVVDNAEGGPYWYPSDFVTKLPDLEPDWRYGHQVEDAQGAHFAWRDNGHLMVSPWRNIDTGAAVPGREPVRPLTIIGVPVDES